MRSRCTPLALIAGALLAATSCASPSAPAAGADSTPPGDTFGWTEGAREMPEPQLRLVGLADDSTLTALDPATEEATTLASLDGVTELGSDGRYIFAAREDGLLTVVDGGAWTVPHGDHSHYYLAEPGTVGEIDGGGGAATVASSAALTAARFPGSGTTIVLDGEALGDGELREVGRIEGEPHEGAAVPLGDRVVATTADAGGGASALVVFEGDGDPTGAAADCLAFSGSAATRVGVVFGCADGAVLATEAGSGVAFERIPYPEGTPAHEVATAFSGRPGRPAVAAVAGDRGAWLLDTRARTWTLLPSPEPLLAASAVSDSEGTIVGIGSSGRVVVVGPGGSAATEPLLEVVEGRLPEGTTLEVDAARAYVNAAGTVLEIDYDDDARVARRLPLDARLLVETGR